MLCAVLKVFKRTLFGCLDHEGTTAHAKLPKRHILVPDGADWGSHRPQLRHTSRDVDRNLMQSLMGHHSFDQITDFWLRREQSP